MTAAGPRTTPSLLPRLAPPLAELHGTRVPVTVLTGFLGSGKTTLLNRLLRQPGLEGTAVVINEFGSVGLDHELVEHSEEDLVLLASGCICCTVRGDLVGALEKLAASDAAQSGQLKRVIVETTGLADPVPILHTLMGDPRVMRDWRLAGVACTVDAFNGMATLDAQPEAVKQAAVADRLLLTKTDVAQAQRVNDLRERLAAINPMAQIVDGPAAQADVLRALLDTDDAPGGAADAAGSTGGWQPFAFRSAAVAEAPTGDADRHGDNIRAHSIVRDTPLPREGFFAWLETIAGMRGADLLRVKGIVHLQGEPDRPLVIHGVQHLFHPPEFLARWPSNDRRSRIVFITRGMERDVLDETLRVFEHRRRRG